MAVGGTQPTQESSMPGAASSLRSVSSASFTVAVPRVPS